MWFFASALEEKKFLEQDTRGELYMWSCVASVKKNDKKNYIRLMTRKVSLQVKPNTLKPADIVYVVLNSMLIIVALFALYFTSLLYLGNKEQHEAVVHSSGISFFFWRLLFNAPSIVICLGLVLLLTLSVRKRISKELKIKRILLIDALILIAGSIVFVYIAHFG